jgi:protease IV
MTQRWPALTLSLLLAACSPPGERPAQPQTAAKATEPAAPAAAANPLAAMGPLGAMMASKLDQPGPYDPPIQSPDYAATAPHFLTFELKGAVDDLGSMSLFGGGGVTELRPLIERLQKAEADPQVKGLVLRFTDTELDMAGADELRAALLAFKGNAGQRKLHCHGDTAQNIGYYVMTACDSIGLQPLGELVLTGPQATPVHLRGLLDRLNVTADFVHVGAFKGAAEPLTRREPSKEMIETLTAVVDEMYEALLTGLQQRGLTRDDAIKTIDTGMFSGEKAIAAKLIDKESPYEDFLAASVAGTPWTRMKLKDSAGPGGFDFEKLQVFLGLVPPKRPSEPHVALVYAVGNIIDGRGAGIMGARNEIAGRTLSAALHNLAADDKVKAVVLRVNSGGGSAMASEQIFQALAAVKAKKPVIVSMGHLAASGGYYISTGATRIFAEPNTLTGSIGVVGGKLVLGGLLKQVGVDTFAIGKGKHAGMWSSMTAWTTDERAMVLTMMEDVYKVFVGHVAETRHKTYDEVHAIAQGRVWTGTDAKERGLVDELGDLERALAEARKLTGVDRAIELEVYPPEPTLKDLLTSFSEVSPADMLGRSEVTFALAQIRAELGHSAAASVLATLEQALQLRDEPILTATMLPLVVR